MAKHELLTTAQTARLLNVTTRTLANYAQRDHDPLRPAEIGGPGKGNAYCPRQVAEWFLRQELTKLQQQAGYQDPIDYNQERARLTRAQADREELKVKEMRRQLAKIELLTFAVANFGAQASAIFETLPGKIKRLCPALSNSDIHEIRTVIAEAQNLAADITLDWSQAPEVPE